MIRVATGRGFTLVELLVSVGIMGALLALGTANFRDYTRRQSLLSTAKSIEANLRLAQEMANSGNKTTCGNPACTRLEGHRVTFGTNSYGIFADCTNGNLSICKGGISQSAIILPPGVTLAATLSPGGASLTDLVFKTLGHGTSLAAGSTAVLTLTSSAVAQTVEVRVTAGGDISTQFTAPAAPTD